MPPMPGLVHDGMYRVSWVDTIATPAAPSIAELNAGLALECQIVPDGLGREASDEATDSSRLCSVFSSSQVGRTGFEVSLTLVRLDTSVAGVTDTAYATLTKGKRGFLVIRDNRPSDDPWAEGDKIEVFRVQCGTRSKANPAPNELQTFTLPLMVTASPRLDATVGVGGYGISGYGTSGYGD